jgi:hypothetical protein
MLKYTQDKIGIDLLCELSVGWYVAQQLDSSGYYVAYRTDGTTPVNVINSFTWLDTKENIVKRADYSSTTTNRTCQIPLPIVSYDFASSTGEPIELGNRTIRYIYNVDFILHAENKAQLINLAGFIRAMLETDQIPIKNYNTAGNPSIGVLYFEDVISDRAYDLFDSIDVFNRMSIVISATCIADIANNYM